MLLLAARLAFADEPAPDSPPPADDTGDTGTSDSGTSDSGTSDSGASDSGASSGAGAGDAPVIDVTEAEQARTLSKSELAKFKPTRNLLPADPRGQTDFTAYSLEWGEVELGLTYISVGVLPGVQLSTVPAFYTPPLFTLDQDPPLAPVYNFQAKVDVLRLGPVDLAPQFNFYTLDWPDLDARFWSVGGMTSIVVARPVSLHVGGYYSMFNLHGMVDADWILKMLGGVAGGDVTDSLGIQDGDGLSLDTDFQTVTLRLASDVRFNRRDSLVLQAQALVWVSAKVNSEVTAGGDSADLLDKSLSGLVNPTQAYLATLSYQATFHTLDVRIGIGVPFDNPAWALQAFELAWRFGGKTRREEHRLQRGFDDNRKTLDSQRR